MDAITNHRIIKSGICECCGNITMCSSGTFTSEGKTICEYAFRWTRGKEDDPWALFILAGDTGQHVGITIEYRAQGNAMMVVDHDRFAWPDALNRRVSCYHDRSQVIQDESAKKWVFSVFDFLFLTDPSVPRPKQA